MKLPANITIESIGSAIITDQNFVASGGEADVFRVGNLAVKIYHDANKMIPLSKIKELQQISATNVLKPLHLVFGNKNNAIGYAMQFIDSSHPMCKLFTKSFRNNNNIDHKDIIQLIKQQQITIQQIHNDGCLIVDLNEMNLLSSPDFKTPIFIDVDSYETKTHKATAIMDSIRDRLVKNNNFTEFSDWYSFAIIAFQLYIGVHPYKGSHPAYKPNEWQKRMDDGVSVLDPKSAIPSICYDLSVIPKSHFDWMKNVFANKDRSIPPMPDSSTPLVIPTQVVFVHGTDTFLVDKVYENPEDIREIFDIVGTKYYVGKNYVYKNKAEITENISSYKKVLLCETDAMNPVLCKLKDDDLTFSHMNGKEIAKIKANKNIMYRNGCIYSIYKDKLFCNSFTERNGKIFHYAKYVSNITEIARKMFRGVICEDLLGKPYLTIPFSPTSCTTVYVKELEKYRIVNMRMEKNICIIIAEQAGIYSRFILIFDEKFHSYSLRKIDDVYQDINFTVLPNGVCCMVSGDSELELFASNSKVKQLDKSPVDFSMKLFNSSGSVFFVNKKCVYSLKTKT